MRSLNRRETSEDLTESVLTGPPKLGWQHQADLLEEDLLHRFSTRTLLTPLSPGLPSWDGGTKLICWRNLASSVFYQAGRATPGWGDMVVSNNFQFQAGIEYVCW